MQNLMPNTHALHLFDKTIYCIRHGIARHNILYPMIKEQAYRGEENIDTKLTEKGKKQAEKLKEIWENPEAATESSSEEEFIPGGGSKDDGGGELSEWEKRLEGMDSGGSADAPVEKDAPKKKGLFGRKKK